jgi:ribosome-associated protein
MKITSLEKAKKIASIADEMKALDISIIDVHDKTSVTDYLVICTGTSDVHTRSIADKIEEKLAASKIKPLRSETKSPGWILEDYGDVVLHVMRDEVRQFYDLETLWISMAPNPDLVVTEQSVTEQNASESSNEV